MNPKTLETSSRLNLIRILSSAPNGLTLQELSQASGIKSEAELKASLGKLYMIGTYPYTPLDYIEVDYDGTKVRLFPGMNATNNIALTPKEWLILRDALIQEKPQYSPKAPEQKCINSIIEKIRSIVPFSEYSSHAEDKTIIRRAIRELKVLTFQYIARDDEEPELRKVNPWFILEENNSYLLGYCHTKKSPRIFRLESMFELQSINENFPQPNQSVTQKTLDEFKKFVDTSKLVSEKAGIWHTRSSYYYLNQIFQLETTKDNRILNNKEYIYSTCSIQERNWFLDNFIGFLPDVILQSPDDLVEDLKVLLNSNPLK